MSRRQTISAASWTSVVICEPVPWDRFIRGPACMWDDVPWIAFEHFLTATRWRTRPDLRDRVPFTHSAEGDDKASSNPEPPRSSSGRTS